MKKKNNKSKPCYYVTAAIRQLLPAGTDILAIVEKTDKTHPEEDIIFRLITPIIHTNLEALAIVGKYGDLSRLYTGLLVDTFEENGISLPFEVEKAIIGLQDVALIYYMSRAGHVWSAKAKDLMKNRNRSVYVHNAFFLSPLETLRYIAKAGGSIPANDTRSCCIVRLADKGYLYCKEGRWYITDKGRMRIK